MFVRIMLFRLLKFFTAIVIVFHCLGVTQVISALSKDKSAFVGMLSMNEEETKKEKESKEDFDDDIKEFAHKNFVTFSNVFFAAQNIYHSSSQIILISHQFIIERPTPPPDVKA